MNHKIGLIHTKQFNVKAVSEAVWKTVFLFTFLTECIDKLIPECRHRKINVKALFAFFLKKINSSAFFEWIEIYFY